MTGSDRRIRRGSEFNAGLPYTATRSYSRMGHQRFSARLRYSWRRFPTWIDHFAEGIEPGDPCNLDRDAR